MAEQKSFLLYLDTSKQWDMLSDDQAGALIKALIQYCATGDRLETDDGMLAMAFSFMAAQIDRDSEKYERTCKKRAEAGKKGGDQKQANLANATFATDDVANLANATFATEKKQKVANLADKDKEREKDTEKDKEREKDTDTESADKPRSHTHTKQLFVPPTVEEVRAYCKQRKNRIDPQRFVNYHASVGWLRNGQPITDWKAVVQLWEDREPPPGKHNGNSSIDMDMVDDLMKCL